jgi:hypothetical protein
MMGRPGGPGNADMGLMPPAAEQIVTLPLACRVWEGFKDISIAREL